MKGKQCDLDEASHYEPPHLYLHCLQTKTAADDILIFYFYLSKNKA